ncbi:MAG: CarD family transcriptional regulator [Oscillospiraceae bacterium]|jgi:CarD family transcriptional regulator|nr:CarD family transcriptional regulator [Oscillospiraceae bacterium]
MFSVGDKIIYGENGVCTVEKIAPMDGGAADKLYYHLSPLIGTGTYFTPVDSNAFMRPVISREEAEALIASIDSIEPAICNDTRFNHVDAFYKELFKQHSCEALVAIVKGLKGRMSEKKTKSSRAESTMKRARDILHGELAIALGIEVTEVDAYICARGCTL